MKTLFSALWIGTASVSLISCAAGPNAQTGAVLGGLAGAAAGGIIGHQSGRGLEGAAIGAGVGAVGGGVLGNAQDQRNAYYRDAYYDDDAPPRRPYRDPYYRGY
jgi:uncharacterized protein YcfJ